MARYRSEAHWATRALALFSKQARETATFRRGIAAATEAAQAAYDEGMAQPSFVGYMRVRGGWPQVVKEAFEAVVGDTTIEGSVLIGPYKIRAAFEYRDQEQIVNGVIMAGQAARAGQAAE